MIPALVIAAALPDAGDAVASAAAVAVAATSLEPLSARGGVVVAELGEERRRGPTMLASAAARHLEAALRESETIAAARGSVCWAHPDAAGEDPLAGLRTLVRELGGEAGAVVACLPTGLWRPALEDERLRVSGGLLAARLPRQRSVAALAVRELGAAGARARVVARPPGAVAGRRAIAGLDPGGSSAARARRLAAALLGPRPGRPLSPPAGAGWQRGAERFDPSAAA